MADKPSRALVLCGDGLARSTNQSHDHLHQFAALASCGFLVLPQSPISEDEDERIVREFAELVDACEAYTTMSGNDISRFKCRKFSIPTLSERFMGMKAAIITNNSKLQTFGGKLGFVVLQHDDVIKCTQLLADSPVDVMAFELLKLLGFQDGKALDTNPYDLVLVHIGAGEKIDGQSSKVIGYDVEYMNGLVGKIMESARCGSEIGSRLHLSVVISHGDARENEDSSLSVAMNEAGRGSDSWFPLPRQSYTMRGADQRVNNRDYCPMLVAQWQDAVTRKDMTQKFLFDDFKEHGSILSIPADRFLHEVAFKLWKAPKYGA